MPCWRKLDEEAALEPASLSARRYHGAGPGRRCSRAAIRAAAAQRALALDLVRNGSRGVFWLEPLLEVERGGQRIAFGPVQAADIPGVLDALDSDACEHPLYLGPTEDIPWLAAQQRLTFARAGLGDPLSLTHYRRWRALPVWSGLCS